MSNMDTARIERVAERLYPWPVPARTRLGAVVRIAVPFGWLVGMVVRASQGHADEAIFCGVAGVYLLPEAWLNARRRLTRRVPGAVP